MPFKTCPACSNEVRLVDDKCWNCSYSFAEAERFGATMQCPFCQRDDIPRGALVCGDCGAAISYVTPMSAGGIIWAVLFMGVFGGLGLGVIAEIVRGIFADGYESYWFETITISVLLTSTFILITSLKERKDAKENMGTSIFKRGGAAQTTTLSGGGVWITMPDE